MTREEAIDILAESNRQNEVMRDNPSTFLEERPKSDGLDGGDCDSPFFAPAAINQLYLVRPGSSQNLER